MSDDVEPIFNAAPGSYPKNSDTEEKSRNTAKHLINSTYIRGEIRVMDKYPNFDGTLDVTTADGVYLGQFNVQVKTWPKPSQTNPGYSCDERFMAACQASLLPVILLVVDNENRKVYWRHIDRQTRIEFAREKKGETYTIKLPVAHCIDGTDESYIQTWEKIVVSEKQKIWEFDFLKRELEVAQERIAQLSLSLRPATDLPDVIIKELQIFLDQYNFALDRQFMGVREMLYYDYWKIGMGVVSWTPQGLSFMLIPIPYGKNEPMVRQVGGQQAFNLLNPGSEILAIVYALDVDRVVLKNNPLRYSYKLLKDEVFRVIENKHLPVEDSFIADEFIISFIDHFSNYLGLEKSEKFYSLEKLKFLLDKVLPVMEAESKSYRDGLTEMETSIDSYDHLPRSNRKRIEDITALINAGHVPKVKVTLWSKKYDFKILYYYISLLQTKGFDNAKRCYLPSKAERGIGQQDWQGWDREILLPNLVTFFENFYRVYNGLLQINFEGIKDELALSDADVTIFVVRKKGDINTKPYFERYSLFASVPARTKVLFFDEGDRSCPVDSRRHYNEDDYTCVVDNIQYNIREITTHPFDFLFSSLPTYAFSTEILKTKLVKFFAKANF